MRHEITRGEFQSRITWWMVGRIVLSAVLLGSLVFFQQRYQIYPFRASSLLYFAIAVIALSAFSAYLLRSVHNPALIAYLQSLGDNLLISWLVTFTGGIDSGFSILYHISIISSSATLSRRGAYFAASLSSILYGAILDMQYYSVLGYERSANFTGGQVLYLLLVNMLSFYLVAFLSGTLSERLRKARQELREKSIDFEDLRVLQDHILRSVGSGIVTLDMAGTITSWNSAAEQITGYPMDEIRERWRSVFSESIKGLFGQTDELKLGPVRFEGTVFKRDGSRAVLGFTASLLRDESDTVRGIILTFQDITKLIEMEEQMRRQERLASVGSLAAGIAHEIRNPLASLSGSIQMLREELHPNGHSRRLMDIVLRETDRLNTIITEFLEYARPKPLSRSSVPIATVLQETVVLLRNSRNFREELRVSCDVDPGLRVLGDPQRLRQVFWNLLINAAQAIRDGGNIVIAASLAPGANRDEIIVSVSDTGEGISGTDLAKIFDPFFTTKANGTGLGLAIAYRIVDDHDGMIDVRSVPGKGTTFTVRLPAAAEGTAAAARVQQEIAVQERSGP